MSDPGATPSPAKARPGALRTFLDVLDHGGPGYVQFAITNQCNARCGFCGFAAGQIEPKARRSVTLQEALDAVDICARNHIGYLLFVGGEPLIHKDLRPMIRHAAQRGLRPMICTNGSLWTEQNMRELAGDGLASVIMSIDTHDAQRHEQNRGLPGVCQKIALANKVFAELGIQTTASVTASRLIEDYDKLPGFLRSLGFKSCTFSYPLTRLDSSYRSFSQSGLVSYSANELIALFDQIKALKARGGFPVVNPSESLADMRRHLRGEPERFPCLAGHRYFYLDWNLDLYRCHAWAKPMCRIYDFDASKLIRDNCSRCMIDCYRDPSVLQFCAMSLMDAWKSLKKGQPLAAARSLLDRRNLASIKAVWENRRWIGGV